MKVYLQNRHIRNTGKGFFFERLAMALKKENIEIITNPDVQHDISLQIVCSRKTNTKRYVLRFDGVWHNTGMDYATKNILLRKSIHKADGIVYQSEFSKKMCDKYLGRFEKKWSVIFNGVCTNVPFVSIEKKHKYVFLAASRWRPHKRLRDIMESFLLANVEDSILYVAGDVANSGISKQELEKYFSMLGIKYLGVIDQKTLSSYHKISDGFLHLSWIDWCPNCVVEAIGAKVPVITNNVGGTQELVGPSGGFVLPLDDEYDFKPCQLYKPPEIDRKAVADAIRKCCYEEIEIDNDHIDIQSVARQYKELFMKVMSHEI